MKYRTFLIIFLTLASYAVTGIAQEKRYRVEIIVLTHLHHDEEPREAGWLRDFSDSLDFLIPEDPEGPGEENEELPEGEGFDPSPGDLPDTDPIPTDPATLDTATGDISETADDPELPEDLLPAEEREEEPWADVIHIEEMGEVMQESWRRLRLSAPFRPEQYLSWEQSENEPFPSLRIHNQETVLVVDPYAEQRAKLAALELAALELAELGIEEPIVFSDQGNVLPDDTDRESEQEPELPGPILFHQLDGTVMLKRTRFLHLEIDLELREAVYDEMAMTQALIAREETEKWEQAGDGENWMPEPSSFLIHSLKQSRQVKSARMEYFDGPVLGVLAYITTVDIEESPDEADFSTAD
jgi:hypothetical protein